LGVFSFLAGLVVLERAAQAAGRSQQSKPEDPKAERKKKERRRNPKPEIRKTNTGSWANPSRIVKDSNSS